MYIQDPVQLLVTPTAVSVATVLDTRQPVSVIQIVKYRESVAMTFEPSAVSSII